MSDELEANLISKCRHGNMDAFERLILKYEKQVFNLAFRMLSDYDASYDVSQEVFIKVYKNIGKFEATASFATWLYRITYNTCIDTLRKLKSKETLSLDKHYTEHDLILQIKDDSATPEENYLQKESVNEIQKAIDSLSYEHKTAIVLRDVKGLSYSEIAEITDTTIGTVKSRISRARALLRKELNKKSSV